MDITSATLLAQDGVINGAVYALLAVGIVLVFAVTRIIFVPQGEFVAFAALTMASLESGKTPGTVWLLLALSAIALVLELKACAQSQDRARLRRAALLFGLGPIAVAAATILFAPMHLPFIAKSLMTMAIVVPFGPILYRIVYQPIANGSVLLLLIVSVAVHVAFSGVGLILFGAEGSRTTAFTDVSWQLGTLRVSGQSIWVIAACLSCIAGLFWFFNNTFRGKALQATAVNRLGAQLMGISPVGAGMLALTLAATIGAMSGLLIGPITTIFYDTGFIIGIKGFVAAIIGGLASYPLAAAGALLVGLIESYSSFWASAYKEVAVFTLILPVLLWRSLTMRHVDVDEE